MDIVGNFTLSLPTISQHTTNISKCFVGLVGNINKKQGRVGVMKSTKNIIFVFIVPTVSKNYAL